MLARVGGFHMTARRNLKNFRNRILFLIGHSNKIATNRCYYYKLLFLNDLGIQITALLRRWLRVQVVVNPLFSFSACFPLGKAACRAVKAV